MARTLADNRPDTVKYQELIDKRINDALSGSGEIGVTSLGNTVEEIAAEKAVAIANIRNAAANLLDVPAGYSASVANKLRESFQTDVVDHFISRSIGKDASKVSVDPTSFVKELTELLRKEQKLNLNRSLDAISNDIESAKITLRNLEYRTDIGGMDKQLLVSNAMNNLSRLKKEYSAVRNRLTQINSKSANDIAIVSAPGSGGDINAVVSNLNKIIDADTRLTAMKRGLSLSTKAANEGYVPAKESVVKNALKSSAYGGASGYQADNDSGFGMGVGIGLVAPFVGKALGSAGNNIKLRAWDKVIGNPESAAGSKFREGLRLWRNFALSSSDSIRKMGDWGESIMNKVDEYRGRSAGEIAKRQGILLEHGAKDLIKNEEAMNAIREILRTRSKTWRNTEKYGGPPDSTMAKLRLEFGEDTASKMYDIIEDADNIFKEASQGAIDRGLSILDRDGVRHGWQPLDDYFPQVVDRTKFDKNGGRDASITATAKKIVEDARRKGKKITEEQARGEAIRKVDQYVSKHKISMSNYLEHSRDVIIPDEFLLNPIESLMVYVDDVWDRFVQIDELGNRADAIHDTLVKAGTPRDKLPELSENTNGIPIKILDTLIEKEKANVYGDPITAENINMAKLLLNRMFDARNKKYDYGEWLSTARKLQVFKLGMAPLSNAFQWGNSIVGKGVQNTYRDFLRGLTRKDAGKLAEDIGALKLQMLDEIGFQNNNGISRLGKKFLDWNGFNTTERFNRVVSTNATIRYVKELRSKLDAGKRLSSQEVRQLDRLGIRVDALRKLEGEALDKLYKKAGWQGAKNEQFLTDNFDLPYHWQSPFARVAMQFKSFGFKQAEFIRKAVLDEFFKGNSVPLFRLVFWGSMFGGISQNLRALLKGDTSQLDNEGVMRELDNLSAFGGFGLWGDLTTQTLRSPAGLAAWVGGPTISDIGEYGYGASRAVTTGDTKPIQKSTVRRIPFIGPRLKEADYFTKKREGGGLGSLGSLGQLK